MTDKEHKAEFERLKAQLYQNRVIFHHRRPFLAELTKFDIQKERVAFSVKFVKSILYRAYCDFMIYFDHVLAKFVSENPLEIAEKVLPYLSPDGNWRQVLNELG